MERRGVIGPQGSGRDRLRRGGIDRKLVAGHAAQRQTSKILAAGHAEHVTDCDRRLRLVAPRRNEIGGALLDALDTSLIDGDSDQNGHHALGGRRDLLKTWIPDAGRIAFRSQPSLVQDHNAAAALGHDGIDAREETLWIEPGSARRRTSPVVACRPVLGPCRHRWPADREPRCRANKDPAACHVMPRPSLCRSPDR